MSDEPHEYEKLPDLLGDIYDTALDSERWNNVLASIIDFVGGRACELVSKDPVSRLGNIKYQVGIDPHYIQLYAETYAKFGPVTNLSPIGQVVSIPDLVPYDDYRRGPFYQEWLRPQDLADTAIVVLEKSAADATFLVLVPGKANSMVDDEMRRRLALIAPHARRALLIGKSMDLKQSQAATFADTLDGLSASAIFVDARGQIVHANAAGQDMLYAGGLIHSIGGCLATRDLQANRILHEVFAACGTGDAGAKAIALPLTAHDGERYVAHVLPLTSGARRSVGLAYTAVAAVIVRKAELESPAEVIGQTYKLTPTEQRVLLAIVEVGGVPETAEALGIAETTVKTHLYRLFDKAGVGRQADLVKLVASFANPLVG